MILHRIIINNDMVYTNLVRYFQKIQRHLFKEKNNQEYYLELFCFVYKSHRGELSEQGGMGLNIFCNVIFNRKCYL